MSQYHHHHSASLNEPAYQMASYDFMPSAQAHHQNSFSSASSSLGFQHPSFNSQSQSFNGSFGQNTQSEFTNFSQIFHMYMWPDPFFPVAEYASRILSDTSESMKPSLSPPSTVPQDGFLKPMPIEAGNNNWSVTSYQQSLSNQQYPGLSALCQGPTQSSLDYHHHQTYSNPTKYWSWIFKSNIQ